MADRAEVVLAMQRKKVLPHVCIASWTLSELRRASGNLNNLIAVTLAFKEDHYCFTDTDIPEVAQRLVQRLAKLWQAALASELPLDDQSKDGVKFMLGEFKKLLAEMPEPLAFRFEPIAKATPTKKREVPENSGRATHDVTPGR